MGPHLLKGNLLDQNCTVTCGPKPKPNQTNTPCNTKISNIAIHMHYPIATLFGDGAHLLKGDMVDQNQTATLGVHKPNPPNKYNPNTNITNTIHACVWLLAQ